MNNSIGEKNRIFQAREVCNSLLDDLETASVPVAQSLMKASRIARLLRDRDAQAWIAFEMRGYPQSFSFASLGECIKYARFGGRTTDDGKYFVQSLPEMEAEQLADLNLVEGLRPRERPTKAADHVELRATSLLMNRQRDELTSITQKYQKSVARFNALRSALHTYAVETLISLEFGDAAESVFEKARRNVDTFVRTNVPNATEQLVAIAERMRDGDGESLSSALMSCRRLISSVADAVFPPQKETYSDASGKQRNVGPENYKNRILAFIDMKTRASGATKSLLEADVEHIAARLDAVYEKACKGVHADVTSEEAQLTVIQTYLLVAEIDRVGKMSVEGK